MRGRGLKPPLPHTVLSIDLSPSMRGRGLKQAVVVYFVEQAKVALHAGAWIETPKNHILHISLIVALHAGAWIETTLLTFPHLLQKVALHAGAWIETPAPNRLMLSGWGRPPCGGVD